MTWLKVTDDAGNECWYNLALVRLVSVTGTKVSLGYGDSSIYLGKDSEAFLAAFREAAVKP